MQNEEKLLESVNDSIMLRILVFPRVRGNVTSSYGTENNDPLNARLQAQEGIDAAIVDNVARVRKGLTEHEQIASLTSNLSIGEP